MKESKLTITVTEALDVKDCKVHLTLQAQHEGCIAHMLYAIPRFIAELEQSLPEKYQARFRAEFLEELNKARKEVIENEG